MSVSKINFIVSDGALNRTLDGEDHISSLVFDVTTKLGGAAIAEESYIYQIFSKEEARDLGFTEFDEASPSAAYEGGLPYFHISKFFEMNPDGVLYVGLKDIEDEGSMDFLGEVQAFAQGKIKQFGLYTRQDLWLDGTTYILDLAASIQTVADAAAVDNMPFVVLLHANVSSVDVSGDATDIEFSKIGTAIGSYDNVFIQIGQDGDSAVSAMQANNTAKAASVGAIGTALGLLSLASVHESIAWLSKFDTAISEVVMGWGDVTDIESTNVNLSKISTAQKNILSNNGYVYLDKYVGRAGTYFSSDQTATTSDYNSVNRVRTINKSRRLVRAALLPTLNQPLYVAADGTIAQGTISQFKTLVSTQLQAMVAAGEISAFKVEIDPKQDILSTNKIVVKYRIIPVGTNRSIDVEIGFTNSIN